MDTNFQPEEGLGFSPKMALCLAAITLVGIDGEFKEDELNKLRKLIQTDENAFLKAFNFYNEHTLDVCIKIVAMRLNDEQRRCAYQVLYDLAHADRDLAESEEKILHQFAVAFRLGEKEVTSTKSTPHKKLDLSVFD
jgi:uncharacterized tellurite resistance protein B-like protein